MLAFTLLLLFASAYSVAAIAWSAAALYLFKTVAHRRPDVRLWGAALGYIPLNIVFRPALLTERGRMYRRRFGVAALVFAIALSTGLAIQEILRALA